jgi:LysR family nitrogen assimilation transcriptional regulator
VDLRQLRYFVGIAECGGFNRAADVLHIAQSALSRQMGDLEAELGVQLFLRTQRGVSLTPAGKIMVERASALLAHFASIKNELAALSEKPHGRVSFGIPAIMRDTLAQPVVQRFNETYPDVDLTFVTGLSREIRDLILAARIDLGVIGLLEPETTLATASLFYDDLVVVGRGPLPLDPGDASVATVMELPLAVSSRDQLQTVLRLTGARTRPDLSRIPEISDSTLLLEMVTSGRYCSILPWRMVASAVADRRLEHRRMPGVSYEWVIAFPADVPVSAAAATIRTMLLELAQQTAADAAPRDRVSDEPARGSTGRHTSVS